jgi:glutathione S-transferase
MKLHITPTSPYARIARAAIIEHGLDDRIEVVTARTREPGSPYYEISPSGRVPFLERDDGPGLEETDLICAYLDAMSDRPPLLRQPEEADWQAGRLHAIARSFLDGLAVWIREMRRPENERSPTILAHEAARADRMLDLWEGEIGTPLMQQGPIQPELTVTHLTLYCALDAARQMMGADALASRPALAAWHVRLGDRPSLVATRPPGRS